MVRAAPGQSGIIDEFPCEPLNERKAHQEHEKSHAWRQKSPGLTWRKYRRTVDGKQGRVFVIDYIKNAHASEGKRKVGTREIWDVEGLRRLYEHPLPNADPVLRLIHVQNAEWATDWLIKKFNITKETVVGMDFGKYVRFKEPQRRGGRPLPRARTWATVHDPWRNINKTAFGVDYLKPYRVTDPTIQKMSDQRDKMMELNHYDEETDTPVYGWDVFPQRLVRHLHVNVLVLLISL